MSLLQDAADLEPTSGAAWRAVALGLAGGAIVAIACVAVAGDQPRPWPAATLIAAVSIGVTASTTAAIVRLLSPSTPSTVLLGVSAWLPVLAFWTLRAPLLALPVTAVVGVLAGLAFRAVYLQTAVEEEPDRAVLFAPAPVEAPGRALGSKIASAGLYGAALLTSAGALGAAGLLLGGACAVLAWLASQSKTPSDRRGAIIQAAIALVVAIPALLPAPSGMGGELGSAHSAAPGPPTAHNGQFSGVVLLTEGKLASLLPAPPRPKPAGPARSAAASPMTIPFSGEYWYFFWPLRRPPDDAERRLGDPLEHTFTDAIGDGQLVMQASQPLPRSFTTDCCRAVEVTFESRDPRPDAISVQLILVDSSTARDPSLALGTQALPMVASDDALRFNVPPNPEMKTFNQILVWFNLKNPRRHRSANLAVRQFELIP